MKLQKYLIVVENMKRSKQFYEQLFGLQVVSDFGEQILFSQGVVLQQKEVWLKEIGQEAEVRGNDAELYIEHNDIAQFMCDVEQSEFLIEYLSSVRERDWGQQYIRMYDLDGHIIEVAESLEGVVKRLFQAGNNVEEIAQRTRQPQDIIQEMVGQKIDEKDSKAMLFETCLPFWDNLSIQEQTNLLRSSQLETYQKGMTVLQTNQECKGIMIVQSGQLRTYLLSEEGREVTLFRIREKGVCIMSAACLLDSLIFDVSIEAMEDTTLYTVPAAVLTSLSKQHPEVELYLYKTANERFSDVVWLLQQILFLGIDKRLAHFLWDEMVASKSMVFTYTQEEIAQMISSAREVVSKVLKYLQEDGIVQIGRGKLTIVDKEKLKRLL